MFAKPCKSQYEVFPQKGYFSKLGAHMTMIEDSSRLLYFWNSLESAIIPGRSIVLDVGGGTGILSMFAAKLGAKKVYTIEEGPIANVAKRLILENRLDKKIEVINGNLNDVKLNKKVDIIVSETIGLAGVEEGIIDIFEIAKQKYAHNKTVLIPSRIKLKLIPSASDVIKKNTSFWNKRIHGLKFNKLYKVAFNNVYGRQLAESRLFLTRKDDTATIEFLLGNKYMKNIETTYTFEVKKSGDFNGFVLWFEASIDDKNIISSKDTESNHWNTCFLPVRTGLKAKVGDKIKLKFQVERNGYSTRFIWKGLITRGKSVIGRFSQDTRNLIDFFKL